MVQPTTPAFTWGADGKPRTPAQVAQQRRVAEALLNSTHKGKGIAGAFADAASGLSSGILNNQANVYESRGTEAAGALFAGLDGNSSTDTIASLLANPAAAWATPGQSGVAEALMNRNLKQEDPMYQLNLQQAQLELEQMRNPTPANPYLNVGNGMVFNQATGEFVQAPGAGAADMPADVQEYEFYRQQALDAGQQPLPYLDYQNALKGNGFSVTMPDGTVVQQGGPAKPPTEAQSKLLLFQTLQDETQPVLLDLEKRFDPANIPDAAARATPIAGNFFQSPEGQVYQTAASAWAEGALRIATGAAATEGEIARTTRTYFAQPGDTPATIKFKAQMRDMYSRAITNSFGKNDPNGATLITPTEFAQQAGANPGGAPSGAAPEVIDWSEL